MKPQEKFIVPLLVLGRTAYRGINILSTLVLFAVWGTSAFGHYASDLGSWLFLVPLVGWGSEKAALKLLPLTRTARLTLLSALCCASGLLILPFLVAFVCMLLLSHSDDTTLAATLALFNCMLGLNQVLVGYHRALRRAWVDVANFLGLALFYSIGLTATVLYHYTPITFSRYLLALMIVFNCVLLLLLFIYHGWSTTFWRHRRLLLYLMSTIFLMGLNNCLALASTSILFFVLSFHHMEAQSSYLYIALSLFNLVFSFGEYLLRIFQPQLVVFLRRYSTGTVQRSLVRRIRSLLFVMPLYIPLLFIVATHLAHLFDYLPWPLPGYVPQLCLLLLIVPLFLVTEIVTYILENLNALSLFVSCVGTSLAFCTSSGLSLLTIPVLGASGALLAMASGEIIHCISIFLLLNTKFLRKREAVFQ